MKEHWVIKASKGVFCGVAVILISGVIVWLFTNVLYIPRNMVTTEAFAKNCELIEEKIDKKVDKQQYQQDISEIKSDLKYLVRKERDK